MGKVWNSMLQMGKLIRQLRKQKGLTQEALCQGLLSKPVLSRIENGLLEPNLFILNALLQRLEKSLEPFEIVVSNKEYEMLKNGEYDLSLRTTVVAEGDYFKDIRKAKGMSQEQFSSDVCARETISKIENGRAPRHGMMQTLMEKLEKPFEKYFGYVIAQEFEVYELVREYQQLINTDVEAAKALRKAIEKRIDIDLPVNRQFLESSELMEQRRTALVTPGEELAGLENCLRYTMPEYDGDIYRISYRQEVIILEEILRCLEELQRKEAARYLAKKMEQKNGKKLKIS